MKRKLFWVLLASTSGAILGAKASVYGYEHVAIGAIFGAFAGFLVSNLISHFK
jgi:hypothetical protein